MSADSVASSPSGLNTPVVFILFDRTDTARRVFEAIRAARPRKLLVFADGPRPDRPGEAERCAAARALIDEVDWDCEVLTNFTDRNMGIPARFASGFKWVFDQVEEAIFLEHDCLPDPSFFSYCEQLLDRYRDDPRVMWIGGTNPMRERTGDASYFFSRINWVWGWATWRRAWQHYDIGVRGLPEFKRSGLIERITPYRRIQNGFMALFELAYEGRWNNWDAQSTFAIWANDGLCIHPSRNLVTNIGFGELALNTTSLDDPLASLPAVPLGEMVHPAEMRVDTEFDRRAHDLHMKWLPRVTFFRRLQKLPGYGLARTSYHALRRAAVPSRKAG